MQAENTTASPASVEPIVMCSCCGEPVGIVYHGVDGRKFCNSECRSKTDSVTVEWLKNKGFANNQNEWVRNFHGYQLRIGYDVLTPGAIGTISMLPPNGVARIWCPTFFDDELGRRTVRVEYVCRLVELMGEKI